MLIPPPPSILFLIPLYMQTCLSVCLSVCVSTQASHLLGITSATGETLQLFHARKRHVKGEKRKELICFVVGLYRYTHCFHQTNEWGGGKKNLCKTLHFE